MSNLIYQVWTGNLTEECRVSSKLMKQYADRIGAEYMLDVNPNVASKLCDVPVYFEWLNLLIDDKFLKYDKILSVDLDVFPVEGLTQNIFDEEIGDIGICTERFQGKYRASTTTGGSINRHNDERWAKVIKNKWGVDLPRDKDNYLKVYNAGMVMFSNAGILKAKSWPTFQEYINLIRSNGFGRFYWVDQNYFHAMICCNKDINYVEMDNGWNAQIHYVRGPLALTHGSVNDERDQNTKFVHVQMSGLKWDENGLYDIVNKPKANWGFKY